MRRGGSAVPLMPGTLDTFSPDAPSSRLLGERHRLSHLEIPEHEHEHFCLHLQTSGSPQLEWWWNGRHGVELPQPGALILLPPGTRDSLRWEGLSERYVISLDVDYMRTVAAESEIHADPEFHTRWHLRDAALASLLAEIGRECAREWMLGELYADMLSLKLAWVLLRSHTVQPVRLPRIRGGISFGVLRTCLEYITENLHRETRLADVARIAGLSQFHFARQFRASTGKTIYQYQLDQRIGRAKRLLRVTSLPIEEIGREVGFRRPASFSRCFALREGIPPRVWRDRR